VSMSVVVKVERAVKSLRYSKVKRSEKLVAKLWRDEWLVAQVERGEKLVAKLWRDEWLVAQVERGEKLVAKFVRGVRLVVSSRET
jgi:hypothetical protein